MPKRTPEEIKEKKKEYNKKYREKHREQQDAEARTAREKHQKQKEIPIKPEPDLEAGIIPTEENNDDKYITIGDYIAELVEEKIQKNNTHNGSSYLYFLPLILPVIRGVIDLAPKYLRHFDLLAPPPEPPNELQVSSLSAYL